MPAKKKYTPKQLREAVEEYFASISATKPVKELVDSGRTNKSGMPVMEYRDATDDSGNVIYCRKFFVPPSIEGLCVFLGVTRQTLHNWRCDEKLGEKYSEILDKVRLLIEAYLHSQLDERPKVAGIIFDLQCNYGWGSEKNDPDAGRTEVSYIPLDNGSGATGDYDG